MKGNRTVIIAALGIVCATILLALRAVPLEAGLGLLGTALAGGLGRGLMGARKG